MRLKVPVNELKNAVAVVKKGLPKIILQEERGHILCEAKDSALTLSATNNDIKARAIVSLTEISEEFSFTIDPKVLEKLLSKISIEEITIEHNEEDKTTKIYTTENFKSFTTIQSFPPEKMLTFSYSDKSKDTQQIAVNKNIASAALDFASTYLAPLKDNKKQYDFIIINKGIVYGANGLNMMGFFVSTAFQSFSNFKIRKESAPSLIGALKSIKDEEVLFIETDNDVGVETSDGSVYFSCLKSGIEAPKINTTLIKSDNPYTMIDKSKLMSVLDRLVASTSSIGAGVEVSLSGKNEKSSVSFTLISNLKTTEQLDCVRIDDESDSTVEHVVDYKLFKSILGSFNSKDLRIYINDSSKFFKVTSTDNIDGTKYLIAGIGSYSKVVNNG